MIAGEPKPHASHQSAIPDQVIDFFGDLFKQIFSNPFAPEISERIKRNIVIRQVEESADAASQSLTRFLLNQKLSPEQVGEILTALDTLADALDREEIANTNVTAEVIAESLLLKVPCPSSLTTANLDPVYRIALHTIVQVLTLVGPVMAEWRKLKFSSTFELPRRVVNRLNQISEQLAALGTAGQEAVDELYELNYRDYLLQRFHRIEAGTVRMTTNLDVDLRELFVMPRVIAYVNKLNPEKNVDLELMSLSAARALFAPKRDVKDKVEKATALDHVKQHPLNVIIGDPGSGKSTFLEWMQLKLASVEEQFIAGDGQIIPLMLRVRQLDPFNLPRGAALIEKATNSKDRSSLMPLGWIERRMKEGRVFLMLDGLDETEPELRNDLIIPWFLRLINDYPKCRFLLSSRHVGYPIGILKNFRFSESELCNFDEEQISEFCRHWCTSVRLARNEMDDEARREGSMDGERIVAGFKQHPYVSNLAKNPLMLSAICLVNFFEGGELPKDRAMLYRLCAEGLLHNWDQRRGIRSEFGFDEKLRACRDVAIAMQVDDRAEYETGKIAAIFKESLGDDKRAKRLLEHIRHRTGLLLERRPDVFAFAHLTFQEYLSARAIHEGNNLKITPEKLCIECDDGRWKEVIALYCGIASAPMAIKMLKTLIKQKDSTPLESVITEAYLSSSAKLSTETKLRKNILNRIAICTLGDSTSLDKFPIDEVTPIANSTLGKSKSNITNSYFWIAKNPKKLNQRKIISKFRNRANLHPIQTAEIFLTICAYSKESDLKIVAESNIINQATQLLHISAPPTSFPELAITSLFIRNSDTANIDTPACDTILLKSLNKISELGSNFNPSPLSGMMIQCLKKRCALKLPQNKSTWPDFIKLIRAFITIIPKIKAAISNSDDQEAADSIESTLTDFVNKIHS